MPLSKSPAWCLAVTCFSCAQLLAQPAPAPTNLIRNGSFEAGPDPGQYLTLETGSNAIEGWTITAGSVDIVGLYWNASNGIRSLDLSGATAGEVRQTFLTTAGEKYRVTFDFSGHPTCGSTVKRLRVSAANESMEFSFDVTGRTTSSMGWKTGSLTFVASSQSTALGFLSLDPSGCGPALDNVVVIPDSTPTVVSASQIASGGGWKTSLTIVNLSLADNSVKVSFRGEDGGSLSLPLTITRHGNTETATASSVEDMMPPGATLLLESEAPAGSGTLVGWAEIAGSGPVDGFAIFRQRDTAGREAEGTAPLESGLLNGSVGSSLLVPFDNKAGFATGVALVNWSSQAAVIIATIRDENGSQIDLQAVAIPPMGHTSFAIPDRFSSTGGRRGIIEFHNSAGTGAVAGLGLRFSPSGTFTSVPAIVQ